MSKSRLAADESVEKRANWESFAFAVPVEGKVNVANESHADPAAHTYTVDVDEAGRASACTCPADEYQPGRCKHRVAVEQTAAVLAAATPAVEIAADGGRSDAELEPADVDARDDDVARRWATYDAGGELRDYDEFAKRVRALGGVEQ